METRLDGPKSLLPSDFSREVPTAAWKWLLQYGLPYSYWQPIVGYSQKDERLVFLVGSPFKFSIGRLIGSDRNEALSEDATKSNAKPRKWYVWGDSHKHCERLGQGPTTVLVEDLVSAHKIAVTGVAETIPLFGTRVFQDVLYYLMTINKPIKLWLDKDQEGVVKKQALWLQTMTGNPVDIIITDKDPKCMPMEALKRAVER
jgi:hypothetical protein